VKLLASQMNVLDRAALITVTGYVTAIRGLVLTARGVSAPVGSLCRINPRSGSLIEAQVIGFENDETLLMPLAAVRGVSVGDSVTVSASAELVHVGKSLLGRVLDGMGRCIDDKSPIVVEDYYPLANASPAPLARHRISQPLSTGVRSIDALTTVGKGQRMGIFAGTGVGKSVLMGMITRGSAADVNVVALIGERGREVGDFLSKELGDDGLAKTVMVVSTSDESPVLRVRAAFVATAIAEFFRDQGADVLLFMDSLTRAAMAQRQIGLAAGEPPATKGYTPGVFAMLPQLVERVGNTDSGSITGLYTVLVEGDDLNDPIADAVRGTLDGHVWLGRKLANRGHWPAVAPLESISRLMVDIVDERHLVAARSVRSVLATWEDIEDLVNIGAYAAGTNVDYDVAMRMKPRIDEFLQQPMEELADRETSSKQLIELADAIEAARRQLSGNDARMNSAATAGAGQT